MPIKLIVALLLALPLCAPAYASASKAKGSVVLHENGKSDYLNGVTIFFDSVVSGPDSTFSGCIVNQNDEFNAMASSGAAYYEQVGRLKRASRYDIRASTICNVIATTSDILKDREVKPVEGTESSVWETNVRYSMSREECRDGIARSPFDPNPPPCQKTKTVNTGTFEIHWKSKRIRYSRDGHSVEAFYDKGINKVPAYVEYRSRQGESVKFIRDSSPKRYTDLDASLFHPSSLMRKLRKGKTIP